MTVVQDRTVQVLGLAELSRAFAVADSTLEKELKTGLAKAGQPVRADAESFARVGIPRIGIPWSTFRIGVTRSAVYVAPVERGTRTRRKRPNLAALLLARSMVPALDRNVGETVARMDDVLATVGRKWETA